MGSKHFTQANGSDIIGREDVREISPLPEHFEMSSQREDNQNFMVLQACPQTSSNSTEAAANDAEMGNTLDRYIGDLREANK